MISLQFLDRFPVELEEVRRYEVCLLQWRKRELGNHYGHEEILDCFKMTCGFKMTSSIHGIVWKNHDTLVKRRGIVSVLIRADTWAPALVGAGGGGSS